jgi:hypothetical protein
MAMTAVLPVAHLRQEMSPGVRQGGRSPGVTWCLAPALTVFADRALHHAEPLFTPSALSCWAAVLIFVCSDRVENLYFAYLFVLRAVLKAAPALTSFDYDTGLPEEDQHTRQLLSQLVSLLAHGPAALAGLLLHHDRALMTHGQWWLMGTIGGLTFWADLLVLCGDLLSCCCCCCCCCCWADCWAAEQQRHSGVMPHAV